MQKTQSTKPNKKALLIITLNIYPHRGEQGCVELADRLAARKLAPQTQSPRVSANLEEAIKISLAPGNDGSTAEIPQFEVKGTESLKKGVLRSVNGVPIVRPYGDNKAFNELQDRIGSSGENTLSENFDSTSSLTGSKLINGVDPLARLPTIDATIQ